MGVREIAGVGKLAFIAKTRKQIKMKKAGLILIFFIGFGCIADAQTVTIGSQIWMAKNLDVSYFRNGEPIPQAKTSDEWKKAGENGKPAWCYYNYDSTNGAIYGKLYNWYAVNDPRGIAPKGWHVPGDAEWAQLTNYLGGDTVAGGKMKDTAGWNAPNTGASNSSGFSGLPGGSRLGDGTFGGVGYDGYWWSSSEDTANGAWARALAGGTYLIGRGSTTEAVGLSVRCVSDIIPITIGSQVWMTKNLDVSYFRNGEPIPQAKTSDEWKKAGENGKPAWCYYNNDSANGAIYGKLYNWYAVSDPRGLTPKGWRVPSFAEWSRLSEYLGGQFVAGGKMKSITGWNAPNTGATNSSGFSGLPGGYRYYEGTFKEIGLWGFWWSSTENRRKYNAWYCTLQNSNGYCFQLCDFMQIGMQLGFSVRCIRD
jgi:uncharacterized protein (TIGR02145 family)